jgi:D-3-phosphoglycerate dehydrogenase
MGKIGIEVSTLCRSLGMIIYAFDPILTTNGAKKLKIESVSLDFLIENSDYISIHSTLTKDTKHLLNKENLIKCKKGVKIINCARGGIINEEDLLNYLKSGHISGIGLDSLEEEPPLISSSSELLMHKKSIITPHIGANTVEAQQLVAKDIATNISNIIRGNRYEKNQYYIFKTTVQKIFLTI